MKPDFVSLVLSGFFNVKFYNVSAFNSAINCDYLGFKTSILTKHSSLPKKPPTKINLTPIDPTQPLAGPDDQLFIATHTF